jgi:hypothetical protein
MEKSELAKNRFAPFFLPFLRKSLISMIIPDNLRSQTINRARYESGFGPSGRNGGFRA